MENTSSVENFTILCKRDAEAYTTTNHKNNEIQGPTR